MDGKGRRLVNRESGSVWVKLKPGTAVLAQIQCSKVNLHVNALERNQGNVKTVKISLLAGKCTSFSPSVISYPQ